jgi:DNA-binding transcriptional regulator YdaS (Cro superfamily)
MLTSVDAVIEALGGPTKIAALAGIWPSAVSNWRVRGEIPPENFLLISDALRAIGTEAEPSVFGFKVEAGT